MNKEQLLELMTTSTARFIDALKARVSPVDAIVTDDTCSNGGYTPFLLGDLSAGRKWIGARVYDRVKSYGVKFVTQKFEKTVEVPADDMTDNPAISGSRIGERLAASAVKTEIQQTLGVFKHNVAGFDREPLFGEHNYLAQDENGNVEVYPAGHAQEGQPVVTYTFNNDIAGDGEAWYLASKQSILRVTQEGADYNIVMKGGSAETSEHTFDTDNLAWGWKARKIFVGGLPFYSLRSKQALTADTFQAALDQMAGFVNDTGESVDNAPTHLIVKKGSAPAAAARKLFGQQFLASGESNIYYNAITVIEVDKNLL